jgi:hypothetical protein
MKITISIFLILTAMLSISQTKDIDVKVNIVTDLMLEKITVKIKTDADSLNHFKVQIIDSKKNIVKSVDLPKAASLIISSIDIPDLVPGNYTCVVYKGEKELYKGAFFKDAIAMEPQPEPVLFKTQN